MQIEPLSQHGTSRVTELDADLQKWQTKLEEFGMSVDLVHTHPDLVRFLFESGTIFQMVCFRNSSESRKNLHDIHMRREEPYLFVQGQKVSWKEWKKAVFFDKEADRIATKGNPAQGWNYISPDGFVPKDRFEYEEIYPVDQLDDQEHLKLKEKAKKFFETNIDTHKDEPKEAVYQIVTSLRDCGLSDSVFTHNLIENFPRHISLRLIDNQGRVYSFGIEMKKKQIDPVVRCIPYTFLTTTNAHVAVPDFEETHVFKERTVTSVPISQQKLEKALQFLSHTNKEGFRFNLMKQNCTTLGRRLLQDFEHDMDTQYTLSALMLSFLPNVKDVPYVGFIVDGVIRVVQKVAAAIFEIYKNVAPAYVQVNVMYVVSLITYIPNKVSIILRNLVVLALGGGLSAYWMEPVPDETKELIKPFLYIHRIVHRWSDLLKEETFDLHYSQKVVEWQRKQNSTTTYVDAERGSMCY